MNGDGMRRKFALRVVDLMVLAAVLGLIGYLSTRRPPKVRPDAEGFARKVDLSPLYRIAVQADGRLRSFESHAKTYMGYVSGPRSVRGQSNGFTYLDLMLRPEQYTDVEMLYVKNKQVRQQIVDLLVEHGMSAADGERVMASGLVSRAQLGVPSVLALLERLGQDLIRTSKAVDALQSSLTVSDPSFLMDNLRVVPPPTHDVNKPWIALTELVGTTGAPMDAMHANVSPKPRPIAGIDPSLQDKAAATWTALRKAWAAEDALVVNHAVAELAGMFQASDSPLYPSPGRLAMESWYFRTSSMTWVWLLYLASVVPLLMSIIYRWDGARKVGMALFLLAFAAHTASTGIRWYISGRWPNSNMFEAVTTTAWLGGVSAIILERIARRTALRNLFALGSAVMSMLALMAAYYLPAQLDSSINNKMAALNDIWLYIHTNMIIWSYAVIGLACIPALLFLRHRWCLLWDNGAVPKVRLLILPVALAVFNYAAYLLLMHVINYAHQGLSPRALIGVWGALAGSGMILLYEILAVRARRAAGVMFERGASGGTAALMSLAGDPSSHAAVAGGGGFLRREAPTASQVYDGATMVLVELSFIMLWTGIVMGAIWADHSWGRPWGWDPKEVFALNTFLIFLILIHVRLKVRDRGFWTAVLAILGFEVMMFNWIVVNFVISGLHSYA